jgi:hypothetical protein
MALMSAEWDRLHRFLDPMDEPYQAPWPAIFLSQPEDLKRIQGSGPLIVRDGAFLLKSFFSRHPRPPSEGAFIYVERSLMQWVPARWLPKVGSYECVSSGSSKKVGEIKGLCLLGLTSETWCSVKSLEKKLEHIKKFYRPAILRRLEKCLLFFPRLHEPGGTPRPELPLQIFSLLVKYLGSEKIRILYPGSLPLTLPDRLNGFDVIDLNDKNLCADPTPLHLLIQRGARLSTAFAPARRKSLTFLPLSMTHGFQIEEPGPRKRPVVPRGIPTPLAFFKNQSSFHEGTPLPWAREDEFWCRWLTNHIGN